MVMVVVMRQTEVSKETVVSGGIVNRISWVSASTSTEHGLKRRAAVEVMMASDER